MVRDDGLDSSFVILMSLSAKQEHTLCKAPTWFFITSANEDFGLWFRSGWWTGYLEISQYRVTFVGVESDPRIVKLWSSDARLPASAALKGSSSC